MYEIQDKTRIVLQMLFLGGTVKIGDYSYQMSDDYELCSIGERITLGKNKKSEPCLLRTFTTLQDFIKLCGKIPDEQITLIAADIALNKVKDSR